MAANVICSVERTNTTPPHARKIDARASVGGRDGRIEAGGRRYRKKYVRKRNAENAASR